jgi:hypothetical protein
MSKRHAFATALALGHLILVACGAAGLSLLPDSCPPGRALRWYGAVTEAGNGYGYFAPSVGSPSRVTFLLSDGAGRTWADALDPGGSPEVRLRVGTIALQSADPELRPHLAASWAARMFGRHPDAREVVVRIELHELPSMAQYRAGERPRWEKVYEATFRRTGQLPSCQEP